MTNPQYGPGDVVDVNAWYSPIPPNSRALFVEYVKGHPEVCKVEFGGMWHVVKTDELRLYRRHIDSPHRSADNERFWKLHPPTKRAAGASSC